MYEHFYKLTTNPFRLAPDPKFCFSHSGYKRAMEYLEYALDQGEGFVMVTGRPGTGKTLLVETFLKETDINRVVARRIAVSNHGAEELLRAVAYAYELDAAEMDKATLRHQIQQYFVQQEQAGRRVLLIVDEAQTLEYAALEELRILADLQTESRLMLQLFLVGQESLQELMHTAGMEQFQQRVIANYHLVPLSLRDARAYIEHRLQQAGWSGDPEFSGAAVLSIYQLSKGVPRHINKICNRLLLLGFGKGRHLVDEEDVQAIAVEMREEQLTPMEANRARLTDAESISNIPEIKDGLLTIADLAIRADNMGDDLPAISEAYRLAATTKGPYSGRHQDTVAGSATSSIFSRFKWKEILVGMAAMLALTTIYVAALPTILGESAGKDTLSYSSHPSRVIPETLSTDSPGQSGSSDGVVIADDVHAGTSADPVVAGSVAVDVDELTPEPRGDNVLIAAHALPESTVVEEEIPVSVSPGPISWVYEPTDVQTQDSEPQQAVDEASSDPASPQQLTDAASVETVSDAALPGNDDTANVGVVTTELAALADSRHDETIVTLLSQGQRLITNYQLLTPEDDNAYNIFLEVLQLDPANKAAHAGMQKIVDAYVTLVRMAIYRNENDRAERYLGRGLSIQPGNRELLALRESINSRTETAPASAAPVAQRVPVSQESEGETDDGLFSRINTFFRNRKADAIRGEVSLPAGWDG